MNSLRIRSFDEDWKLLEATGDWLLECEYVLAESRGPEAMSAGLHRYSGARIGILIWADRGQWFIDAQPNRVLDEWFNLEAWSVCLGEPALFHDMRPRLSDRDWVDALANSWWLQPQVEYLRAHLADIEDASDPARIQQTMDCLVRTRAALWRDYREPNVPS